MKKIKLTLQPKLFSFDVKELKIYRFEIDLFSETLTQPSDACLIFFKFNKNIVLTEEELKINNLSSSSSVGYYKYISIPKETVKWVYEITIPSRVEHIQVGLQVWKNISEISMVEPFTFKSLNKKNKKIDFKFQLTQLTKLNKELSNKENNFNFKLNKISKELLSCKKSNKLNKNSLIEEGKFLIYRTGSFRLGNLLINSTKSFYNFIRLPRELLFLIKNKKTVPVIKKIIDNRSMKKTDVNNIQALSILDPISEVCWGRELKLYRIDKFEYSKQISNSTSYFAFFESAWHANQKEWIYAFNSPNQKHNNAQKLISVIELLKEKGIPIVFWNKEDPMHYDMFLPIAKLADYIFTTDLNMVSKYKVDTNNHNVYALTFAAPIADANPINRFNLETENVCFAGTYYAKNHEGRKKQMDNILPSLLKNGGVIYDRSSSDHSDKYLFPNKYKAIIRPAIKFEDMLLTYKKFKVFLNVNTITNSPTMMSRRVYELLACGTPVVSTPSKALMEQFPGIVLTVKDEEEANIAVYRLLNDKEFWYKTSHLGYREVMLNHTYFERTVDILTYLKIPHIEETIDVAIFYKIDSMSMLDNCIETILNQTKKISMVYLSVENIKNKVLKKYITLLKSNNINVYEKFNISFIDVTKLLKEKKVYLVPMHSSNIYFKHYIADMLLPFKYSTGICVGKGCYYKINNKITLVNEAILHTYTNELNLYATILKSHLISSLDISKEDKVSSKVKDSLYSADQFNFISLEEKEDNILLDDLYYNYSSKIGI